MRFMKDCTNATIVEESDRIWKFSGQQHLSKKQS